jgi:hypothetical protein
MDVSELRAWAVGEADELGPETPGNEVELWREERWGAVVLLAGLARMTTPSCFARPRTRWQPSGRIGKPHGCS